MSLIRLAVLILLVIVQKATVWGDNFRWTCGEQPASKCARLLDPIREQAEHGDPDEQRFLGIVYQEGWAVLWGVPQDAMEAAKWFRKAAEQGDDYSQRQLGELYEKGQGVPQDYIEAVKWYRKVAEKSYSDAMFYMGCAYESGRGVPQDYAEAASWYRKAAARGNTAALNNLGEMYEFGRGIPQDYVQAHKWYNLAAAKFPGPDRDKAEKNREAIAAKMTPAQIAEAQKLAREWRPGKE